MFRAMTPVGCVTRYAPLERLKTVRNKLRTLRVICVREKGVL